jgi:hypothetical protein
LATVTNSSLITTVLRAHVPRRALLFVATILRGTSLA